LQSHPDSTVRKNRSDLENGGGRGRSRTTKNLTKAQKKEVVGLKRVRTHVPDSWRNGKNENMEREEGDK